MDKQNNFFSNIMHNNLHQNNNYNNKTDKIGYTKPQTIKENLGIIFNNDSLPQLTNFNQDTLLHNNDINIETKHIIISGEDRPWIINNDENTFNFRINCGDISLINNNQSSSANIKHSLENIISISVDSILLPNRLLENNLRPSDFPFIQLQIDGIEYTTYGTNKSLDKLLSILTQKTILPATLDNVNYVEFINNNKFKKIFNTPKSKLNKLNLSILRHDGENLIDTTLLNNRDVLNIKLIYYNSSSSKLYIQTDTYFNTLNFQTGDIIKIKNYTFRESDLNFSECFQFNNFINRLEGHIIISTAKSTVDSDIVFHNLIEIEYPRFVNIATGKYETETWFSSLITKTNVDTTLENDNTGKLINTSIQPHIIFTIKTINKYKSI